MSQKNRKSYNGNVLSVSKQDQTHGIGSLLIKEAEIISHKKECSFLQVKTLKQGVSRKYDLRNLFYQKMGFHEFEVMPYYWNEKNPSQIYVKYIGNAHE